MKFEEVLTALREGKKIRRKDIIWQNYYGFLVMNEIENEIFSDSVVDCRYRITKDDLNTDDWEICKEPILNDGEKEYLKNLVTPFKDIVISITKFMITDEYSTIQIDTVNIIERNKYCIINLPYFKTTEHFLHMEIGKKYTLDDLDIL